MGGLLAASCRTSNSSESVDVLNVVSNSLLGCDDTVIVLRRCGSFCLHGHPNTSLLFENYSNSGESTLI